MTSPDNTPDMLALIEWLRAEAQKVQIFSMKANDPRFRNLNAAATALEEALKGAAKMREAIESVCKQMEYAVGNGMSWIDHGEALGFIGKLRRASLANGGNA